jgi:hypothetical protein
MASLFGARTVEEPTFTVIKKAAEYEVGIPINCSICTASHAVGFTLVD